MNKYRLHPHPLFEILQHRIAILDGAMGTTIRTYGMTRQTCAATGSGTRPRTC
jgi:methionine synthase I (cobalamin-dependent)